MGKRHFDSETYNKLGQRCSTCRHWKQNTFYDYEGAENDGFCSEIGSEITIELKTGWDGGYVDYIETKSTFGCVLHNEA